MTMKRVIGTDVSEGNDSGDEDRSSEDDEAKDGDLGMEVITCLTTKRFFSWEKEVLLYLVLAFFSR